MASRMLIEGKDFSLYKDYDQKEYPEFPRILSFRGKVTYLEARVELILISPCRLELERARDTNMGLILATATCAGISAASTFLKGQSAPRGKDREYFLHFIRDYMNSILVDAAAAPQGCSSWAEWLYRGREAAARIKQLETEQRIQEEQLRQLQLQTE